MLNSEIPLHAVPRMILSLLAIVAAMLGPARADQPVRFADDIQPLLSDRCYACHGPDEKARMADLRLDQQDAAFADRGNQPAIVPGQPEESELFRRITADNPARRMPPEETGKSLSPEEIELFRRWIAQGADWQDHWSFVPPQRPDLPPVEDRDGRSWPRNAIDHFTLARMQAAGLQPAPAADRETLIRRLSFDLIGLPPTPEEVDAFVDDDSPGAYERLVDRLLDSDHYGERMAMLWLDAARYSDTDGFQADATRTNWPWRDWVVDAYNANMPFDQFTIEQFAGDLLPDATDEQILATGFHRNHMTNGEGGRDPEESRIDYVIDRVNTTGTVWLGLTLGCAQCHTHKYDPVSQAEYYQLSAFFNSIDEDGRAGSNAKPYLSYKPAWGEQAIADGEQEVKRRQRIVKEVRDEAEDSFAEWLTSQIDELGKAGEFRAWHPLVARTLDTTDGTRLEQADDGIVQATGPNPRHEDYVVVAPTSLAQVAGLKLELFPHESHTGGGLSRSEEGHIILTNLKVSLRTRGSSLLQDVPVASATADYSPKKESARAYGPVQDVLDDDPRTGWTTRGSDPTEPRTALFAFAEPVAVGPDHEFLVELRQRSLDGQHNIGRFRLSLTDQPGPAVHSLDPAPLEQLAQAESKQLDDLPEELRQRLREQFFAEQPQVIQAQAALDRAKRRLNETKKAAEKVNVMVLQQREEPRPTHILERGVWDQKGDEVEPGVLSALSPWTDEAPRDRLGLARWLVSRENPLTARVIVNQYWQMIWGAGLVRTPEDFGMQGERPTHPELLDWLAVEFIESGWDTKHILKTIVTSSTYRQSSDVSPEQLARDPENRLLARAARYRLPSWMIRDMALRAGGLLNPELGGPPVFPYQPEGVWQENTMGRFTYEPSEGADQYRRTVYAFWRRSVAPTFLFDSAERRVCEINVSRTNTPLQALTLLNDLTYLESSRALAEHVLLESDQREQRIQAIYRRGLARLPDARELEVLSGQIAESLDYYQQHPDEAAKLVSHGQSEPDAALDVAELAAYMIAAGTVLNLDEAITRE